MPVPTSSGLARSLQVAPADTRAALRAMDSSISAPLREVSWIAECESRWNPAVDGPVATGLFQFIDVAARHVGIQNRHDIARMSRAEQVPLLAKLWRGLPRTRRTGDAYLRLFWPAAEARDDSHVIAAPGTTVWTQNPALRSPGGGAITAGSVRAVGTPPARWPTEQELRDLAGKAPSFDLWGILSRLFSPTPPLVAAARKYLGTLYQWGGGHGGNNDYGLDCSGLVIRASRDIGRPVTGSSETMRQSLPAVDATKVRPGDLVFYGAGRAHHVAIITSVSPLRTIGAMGAGPSVTTAATARAQDAMVREVDGHQGSPILGFARLP